MSITEKETGNPSKRKGLERGGKEKTSERGEEGQRRKGTEREKERKKKRRNNEQRACKGYSRIYYIDIYSLF